MYLEPLCDGLAKAGRNFLAAGDPANLPWEGLDTALLLTPRPIWALALLPTPARGVARLVTEVWWATADAWDTTEPFSKLPDTDDDFKAGPAAKWNAAGDPSTWWCCACWCCCCCWWWCCCCWWWCCCCCACCCCWAAACAAAAAAAKLWAWRVAPPAVGRAPLAAA